MDLNEYRAVAHRGLHNREKGIPENSLPAFQKAVDCGVAIELDVHLTKDGEIVVFHDENLKRMTGLDRIVEECSCAELVSLRLLQTECGIPLMNRVLRLVGGKVPLLIELKDNGFTGALPEKLIPMLAGYRGEYMLQSFNPYILYWLRKNAPRTKRGQLSQKSFELESRSGFGSLLSASKQAVKKQVLGNLMFNWLTKPDFIAYNIHDLKQSQSKKWRGQGFGLLAWTVRTEGDLRKARWLCDGAIFENLDCDTATAL